MVCQCRIVIVSYCILCGSGDMWAISKSLLFAPNETFLAQSTFHAPSTRGEVAIEPLSGYRASSWSDGGMCGRIEFFVYM